MEKLSVKLLKKAEYEPKILQFGEGNFLRAFVGDFVQQANEAGVFNGSVAIVKPRRGGDLSGLCAQDLCWMVVLRGREDGVDVERIRPVSCASSFISAYDDYADFIALARCSSLRFVVSNTTEAGIVYDDRDRLEMEPPESFPGKLAKLLYERYVFFGGDESRGLIMLPVELIDNNGAALRDCVIKHAKAWGLGEGFMRWLDRACVFCSTLVDRIVSGYPQDAEALWQRLGYRDDFIVAGEPYASWVIESGRDISAELPLAAAGLPVTFTRDLAAYKKRKVRILNGAHTSFVLASYLMGNDTVGESMADARVRAFVERTLADEVLPTIDLSRAELESYAASVLERFENPYVRHLLLSISLNSVSKWRTRCLPTVVDNIETLKKLPVCLTFSLAALCAFYQGEAPEGNKMRGFRGGAEYTISDDAEFLQLFAEASKKPTGDFVREILSNTALWGRDLTALPGFEAAVAAGLADIRENGMAAAMQHVMERR